MSLFFFFFTRSVLFAARTKTLLESHNHVAKAFGNYSDGKNAVMIPLTEDRDTPGR